MPEFEPIPYRIQIDVTGHRNLGSPAVLQRLVKKAIDTEIAKLVTEKSRQNIERVRCGGSTAISFSVLSQVAEGADRLVPRAILDYPGARLEAILSLTVDDYLEDFETEESKSEFRDLLAPCRRPVPLGSRGVRDDRNNPAGQVELRRDAYSQVGHYIVDHCDVLIAT